MTSGTEGQERRRPQPRPPAFLSLEPIIRCPNRRCGEIPYGQRGDLLTYQCAKCGARWWANRFAAGDIRSQIRAQFDGNESFVELLDALGAPERIDKPMYWQLWISGNEQYHLMDHENSLLTLSHELIRKILGLLKRRP